MPGPYFLATSRHSWRCWQGKRYLSSWLLNMEIMEQQTETVGRRGWAAEAFLSANRAEHEFRKQVEHKATLLEAKVGRGQPASPCPVAPPLHQKHPSPQSLEKPISSLLSSPSTALSFVLLTGTAESLLKLWTLFIENVPPLTILPAVSGRLWTSPPPPPGT